MTGTESCSDYADVVFRAESAIRAKTKDIVPMVEVLEFI